MTLRIPQAVLLALFAFLPVVLSQYSATYLPWTAPKKTEGDQTGALSTILFVAQCSELYHIMGADFAICTLGPSTYSH